MRQRSRAWIVADAANPSNRFVFINADIAMGDTGVRRSIVSELSSQFPGVYNNDNIALVSTHQHSGVGGYLEDLLPQITSLGYVKETADAIVSGTVLAVQRAHANLQPGQLSVGNTTVVDGNINRSPFAYLANPAEERAMYQYDQDKDLTLLRFDDASGNARGFLSFYPVHGTSLYENNTLRTLGTPARTLTVHFVKVLVSLGTANLVNSNIRHVEILLRTAMAAFRISDFESNMIIAQLQVDGAKTLMSTTLPAVQGPVKYVHTYMNMSYRSFQLPNGTTVQTCPPAMGEVLCKLYDGPGAFDFIQGDNSSDPQNPFWEIVKGAITPLPPPEQIACQLPKPILLDTGYANSPYQWSPNTVDIQMLRAGNLVILVIPGELTTMAGRRLRDAVRAELISSGVVGDDAYVVIAGPANTYAHYVATKEEYAVQRYEGASTIFGQWTLDSYIDKYTSLVSYLNPSVTTTPPSDPAPQDQTSKAISLQTPVIVDNAPFGKSFGSVLIDVATTSYQVGDTVVAQFVGANPRNNLRLEQTFLNVDQVVNGQWTAVKSDSHPSTRYEWLRTSEILGYSTVNISWTIESGTPSGTYRLTYFGDSKPLIGSISAFTGHSSNFTVS
ncbi:hypothetical protein EW026_g6063 [Hermanssonia centrifuga]|uniref:Neutral ceramidase n=1 Tax=Hermanssonia centrifuga TaxID=98765 RepID=A0A4S4KC53_9APHY|nr:hypothetical protein EW026_g6063 [Hermanssonia centrifuga]